MVELAARGLAARSQVEVPVAYKGLELGLGFRADVVVEPDLLLELKAVEDFTPIHLAQVMTYLKLLGFKRGLLINFNKKTLAHGIKRVSI